MSKVSRNENTAEEWIDAPQLDSIRSVSGTDAHLYGSQSNSHHMSRVSLYLTPHDGAVAFRQLPEAVRPRVRGGTRYRDNAAKNHVNSSQDPRAYLGKTACNVPEDVGDAGTER